MTRTEHIARMVLGFILYWLICRLMPAGWWCSPRGLFWWAVPIFGYYAYHEGPWWMPLQEQWDRLARSCTEDR